MPYNYYIVNEIKVAEKMSGNKRKNETHVFGVDQGSFGGCRGIIFKSFGGFSKNLDKSIFEFKIEKLTEIHLKYV